MSYVGEVLAKKLCFLIRFMGLNLVLERKFYWKVNYSNGFCNVKCRYTMAYRIIQLIYLLILGSWLIVGNFGKYSFKYLLINGIWRFNRMYQIKTFNGVPVGQDSDCSFRCKFLIPDGVHFGSPGVAADPKEMSCFISADCCLKQLPEIYQTNSCLVKISLHLLLNKCHHTNVYLIKYNQQITVIRI